MSFDNLNEGISVIIPTYKGEDYIRTLLDSLVNQTLNPNLFEAILIVNGEKDSTPDIIKEYQEKYPKINLILTYSDAGVSNARNHGIEISTREYTVFVDDDDFISENYLETLYKYAKPNRIVVGTFYDINQDTGEVQESYLTPPLLKTSGIIKNPYSYMPDILVITTDKLIPTKAVKKSSFNPDLRNGVDISYYARFYPVYDFEFYLIDKSEGAIYYRLWRDNSISRQPLSYEFNITGRLKVINDINKGLELAKNQEMRSFLESLTGGQITIINRYLKKHPEDLKTVCNDIKSYNYEFFPYKYLNEDFNNLDNENSELIISYAFPPTNTTTSNTVAKRILTEKNNVSVICASLNDMDKDYEFEKIVNQFVVDKMTINTEFDNSWAGITNFVKHGMVILREKEEYERIYSRSFFVHSNFLAFSYKLENPETHWTAEFSDPIVQNTYGRIIEAYIDDEDDPFIDTVNWKIPYEYEQLKKTDTINYISVYLTFIFADEIIFTNKNQQEIMTKDLDSNLKEEVLKKSTIAPHPTLDKKYYYLKENSYEVDNNYVNFAYFGVVYPNRNFEDIIDGLDNLNEEYKDKFRLHLFTPNITMFEQLLSENIYEKTKMSHPISYLEFLNILDKFDILIVEDSKTKGNFEINPFLPSKISDYIGSESDIWSICEESSPMDKLNEVKYKSRLGDIKSSVKTANKIMQDKLKTKEDSDCEISCDESIEYLQKRISQLTTKIDELIQVANEEFRKDNEYEKKIQALSTYINLLENENKEIKTSNSWKITKPLRDITNKFK